MSDGRPDGLARIDELAARDNVVLVGRASTVILRDVRHALRVRVIASEGVRAQRIEQRQGLTADAALETVRHANHDLAAGKPPSCTTSCSTPTG